MGRNIEIKASLTDDQFERIKKVAAELAGSESEILRQTDTFFNCVDGRLKLREFGGGLAELIFYKRSDVEGPKASSYERVPTDNPTGLLKALSGAYGIRGTVCKRREVFLVGNTRIHLDCVERLGKFLELEVVLEIGDSDEAGHRTANELLQRLGVEKADLVTGAYIDLLEEQNIGQATV